MGGATNDPAYVRAALFELEQLREQVTRPKPVLSTGAVGAHTRN